MKGIALLLTLVLMTAGAQGQLGSTADTTGNVSIPDVGGSSTTGAGSTTPVSTTTADAVATIENGTIAAKVNASADLGRHVDWSFDLPLRDDSWRFRSAAGARSDVHINTSWRIGDEPTPWPEGSVPSLHISTGRETIHKDALNSSAFGATFVVTHDELVRGKATPWTLTFHLHGDTAWTSGYDGNRTSLALPAPGASVTIHHTVWARDRDADGRADDIDNCPDQANRDQANLDGDIYGDVCDDDDDGDGWSDAAERDARSDPRDRKSTPLDRDADGHNNTAEEAALSNPDDPASTPDDPDADGYSNDMEIAAGSDPHNAASTPLDPDGDGIEQDNCPRNHNPSQADADADGIGDACDTRPQDGPAGDEDGDGVANRDDNCRLHPNPGQENMDNDRLGDVCDPDLDGDGYNNWDDAYPTDAREWRDHDGDGVGDNADQDDDNDGLSDSAEIAAGTDPLRADTDGDRYSDLDELRLGSDPLDPYSPDYRPSNVRATGQADGSVVISWQSSGDPRVVGYTVWAIEDLRIVGRTQADTLTDTAFLGGAATYAVQARFADDDGAYHPDEAITAVIFAEDVIVWQQQAAGDAPETGTRSDDGNAEVAPSVDVPGLPLLLVLGAIAIALRRQR